MSIFQSQVSDPTAFSPTFGAAQDSLANAGTGGGATVPSYAMGTNALVTTRPARPERPDIRKRPAIIDRQAVTAYVREALDYARRLEAAADSDPMSAAIAGLELRDRVRELWKLRHVRGDDWATVVNKLQVAIMGANFEEFTRDMANAVRMVVESHLGPDADNDDVRASTLLLSRNGLDAWKALAPPTECPE